MTPSDPVELVVVVVLLLLAFLPVGIVGWRLVFARKPPEAKVIIDPLFPPCR